MYESLERSIALVNTQGFGNTFQQCMSTKVTSIIKCKLKTGMVPLKSNILAILALTRTKQNNQLQRFFFFFSFGQSFLTVIYGECSKSKTFGIANRAKKFSIGTKASASGFLISNKHAY